MRIKSGFVLIFLVGILGAGCEKRGITAPDIKGNPWEDRDKDNPGNGDEDDSENILGIANLPDFSYAGFERNEEAIPMVPVVKTLSPIEGSTDDGQRIQNAIDQVGNEPLVNGYRGAVLLKKGAYRTNMTIYLKKSGVVLRGEGQGEEGTVLTFTKEEQSAFIRVDGSGSESEVGTRAVVNGDVKAGERKIPMASTTGFQVGDRVLIKLTPNQKWLDTLDVVRYGWTIGDYRMGHKRTITAVEKDGIYVDIPMVDYFYERFGGGYVVKYDPPSGQLSHVGIENLNLKSTYSGDNDENHGWEAVRFSKTTNSWVRNVSAWYFGYSAVALHNSDFNTVQDCAMLWPKSKTDGGRKYSFYIGTGTGNLFQRCYTKGGRHDFVTGARVMGPNVFLDGLATETKAGTGPHHRWATGLLFDNISAGDMEAQDRGDYGTGHGWAGVQTMFWNSKGSKLILQNPQIGVNWAVGFTGGAVTDQGPKRKGRKGIVESDGVRVTPRSLFIAQLEKRLGQEAVDRVVLPEQEAGDIWDKLEAWSGEAEPLINPF